MILPKTHSPALLSCQIEFRAAITRIRLKQKDGIATAPEIVPTIRLGTRTSTLPCASLYIMIRGCSPARKIHCIRRWHRAQHSQTHVMHTYGLVTWPRITPHNSCDARKQVAWLVIALRNIRAALFILLFLHSTSGKTTRTFLGVRAHFFPPVSARFLRICELSDDEAERGRLWKLQKYRPW